MGAIKDVTDLVIELEKRVTDRKTLELLLPIKQKINQAEKENLDLEKSHFQSERELASTIDSLKVEKTKMNTAHASVVSGYDKQISELKSVIESLRKPTGQTFMTK